jgi:hypothetical protein
MGSIAAVYGRTRTPGRGCRHKERKHGMATYTGKSLTLQPYKYRMPLRHYRRNFHGTQISATPLARLFFMVGPVPVWPIPLIIRNGSVPVLTDSQLTGSEDC